MTKRNNKNFFQRLFSSQIFLTIFGLVVLVFLSFPLARNLSQRHKIDKEVAKMQEEIDRIEKKNSGLKQLVNYLESDQFAESEARSKLGLRKNGEQVVGIKEEIRGADENIEPQTVFNLPGLQSQPLKSENNPTKWWKYFFNQSTNRQ